MRSPVAVNRKFRVSHRGDPQGGLAPLVGGAGSIGTCQRFFLACPVLPAGGDPSRPGLPPEGETGKGAFKFLAAAGDYRRGYPLKSHSAAHSHKSSQPLESRNSRLLFPYESTCCSAR